MFWRDFLMQSVLDLRTKTNTSFLLMTGINQMLTSKYWSIKYYVDTRTKDRIKGNIFY